MKKVLIAVTAVLVSAPVFAQDQQPKEATNAPIQRMEPGKGHQAFEKAHKEHMAKLKATKEKMEKLVKEYNKLPDGKKKEAKRAEIANEVQAIHEEQLKFKGTQLGKFEERLASMKEGLAKESSAEGKQEWVNRKTDELIANEGDVRALFKPEGADRGPRPMMGRPGRHGHRGGHFKGPRGPRPGFDKGPRYEKPVEMPKDK